MINLSRYIQFIFLLLITAMAKGQDPSFSQFFASPLNVNPALTANTTADWRLISNLRNQWLAKTSSYTTGTVSYERKLFQNKMEGTEEKNRFALGGMMMYDRAMYGAVNNNYASFNMSYNVLLSDYPVTHRLGTGVGFIYGDRRVDYSALTFEEQFTGVDFNANLPTGEFSLNNMKPYLSISVGLLYSMNTERNNLDIGISTFHVNRPKQTFIEDEKQFLARRNVIHANFETFINDYLVLNLNSIYQEQSKASYFSAGGGFGYYMQTNEEILINGGLWLWSNKAVFPYLGVSFNRYQVGMTFDVPTKIVQSELIRQNAFEFSIVIKGERRTSNFVPCPWK